MAEDNVQQMVDGLLADAELRDRFRSDPVVVVEEFAIELDDDKRERLRGGNWAEISDEELQRRLPNEDWGFWF
jgi:hypothetical protein